jgi:hypothetical protein
VYGTSGQITSDDENYLKLLAKGCLGKPTLYIYNSRQDVRKGVVSESKDSKDNFYSMQFYNFTEVTNLALSFEKVWSATNKFGQ